MTNSITLDKHGVGPCNAKLEQYEKALREIWARVPAGSWVYNRCKAALAQADSAPTQQGYCWCEVHQGFFKHDSAKEDK